MDDRIFLQNLPSQLTLNRSSSNQLSASGFKRSDHDETDSKLKNLVSTTTAVSAEETIEEDASEFPDGGFVAWTVVFGSFLGLIPVFGLLNSIGSIQTYISSNQLNGTSGSVTGWIFSIYLAIAGYGCVFSGTLFDRLGRTFPMLVGTVLYSVGLFTTAECTTVYQFILSFGVCVGLGTALNMTPLIGCVSHFFYKKRAIATGIATIGGSVGGIFMPIMLRKLYVNVGYKWAIRILAFICTSCLLSSYLLTKERLPKDEEYKKMPFSKQLTSYFTSSIDIKSLRDKRFLFCVLAILFSEMSLTTALTYLPQYAMAQGVSEDNSYLLVTLMNVVGIFGRFIPNLFADKYGRFNIMIITSVVATFLCLVLWLPFGKYHAVLYTFCMSFSFFTSSIFSLTPVCLSQICKTNQFGARFSTMYFCVSFGNLVSVPIAGAIISKGSIKEYNNFVIYCSLVSVIGAICWLSSRYYIVKTKIWCKV